ncbi:MAG TPA: SDR family oxidoreductase [Bacteroidales bacterium]|nr:SDR family oxidoreductase [Bacteroidales bacterium]
MENKVAIVTGGGSGIGFAIAKVFTERGVHTVIIGRNREKLDQACEKLGSLGNGIVADLSDLKTLPGLVKQITDDFGRIDILVNNAGIHHKAGMTEVKDDDYQKVILTNQTAVFSLSREVVNVMIRQKSGVILNISSMASQYGIPRVMGYTAAKSAVEGMTRAMAVELSPLGIRVNCLAPGFISTEMSQKALDNDFQRKEKVLGRTPMGRLGTPMEVAEAAYFLCSEAAGYITGVVLPVDGGNSIGF